MKKISFIVLIISLSFLLLGCDVLLEYAGGHSCLWSEWIVEEEASCSTEGVAKSYCAICFKSRSEVIEKAEHTPVYADEIAPTCTKEGYLSGYYCSKCNKIISGLDKLPSNGHTVVIDPAVEPEGNRAGKTEGSHCSSCGEVIVKQLAVFASEYSNSEKYHTDYAYNSLLTLSNGDNMADFYQEIASVASGFHNSDEDAETVISGNNEIYYAAEIYFDDNFLTYEEAVTVWTAFYMDHPLYYWMSNVITYTDKYLALTVGAEYADGESRELINVQIYDAVEYYVTLLEGESSVYNITLALHDTLIQNADYAYEADGVTPSMELSAHNILGVLLGDVGVCDSYAKSFQLLLNYCGIDNIYVTGYASVAHAWNLVKLDDGRWYWYDLTWDDQPGFSLGVRHNYFCVTDETLVKWTDGSTNKNTKFIEDHFPNTPGSSGVNYFYSLPQRADSPYSGVEELLRGEVIVYNGLHYVYIGYKTFCLVRINIEGNVVIPQTVTHNGVEYTVRSIGYYDVDNRVINAGSVIYYDTVLRDHLDVTSIYIPKTVEYIWDYAFDYCKTIERFEVSEENEKFRSLDGVLYTKSFCTLIKYPLASKATSFRVPSYTAFIAYGAFGDGGNVFCPKNLKSLVIPTTVKTIGVVGAGRGFHDVEPEDMSKVYYIDGYITRLYYMLGFGLDIK